jgi:hypothetical protein
VPTFFDLEKASSYDRRGKKNYNSSHNYEPLRSNEPTKENDIDVFVGVVRDTHILELL